MGKKKTRTAIPAEIERQVMVEASYRCSLERCASTSSLQIHHIDYDRDNHDPANLLVLCSNCHGRATRKEIDRKACLMIKDLLRMQKSSKAELEEMKDAVIEEMRNLVGSQEVAKPLEDKDRGTRRPSGRIQAAMSQARMFHQASVALPNDVLRSLMLSLYGSGEMNAALEIQRIVANDDDATAQDFYNLAVLLQKTGHQGEAEHACRKAIAACPKFAAPWWGLGSLLRESGKMEEARLAFQEAIGIDSSYASAWGSLGCVLLDMGLKEESKAAFERALQVDPEDEVNWCNYGKLLWEIGLEEEAEQAVRNAIRLDSNLTVAWTSLGMMLQGMNRREEAEEAHRKAIETCTHSADEHNGLAYLLWECGRFEDAELEVMEALKDDPNHVYAHATLGLLRLEQNDLDEGRQGYEKAIELKPDDLPLLQKYHYEYGRALARNGRIDEARREVHAALGVDSTHVPREQIEAELAKLG